MASTKDMRLFPGVACRKICFGCVRREASGLRSEGQYGRENSRRAYCSDRRPSLRAATRAALIPPLLWGGWREAPGGVGSEWRRANTSRLPTHHIIRFAHDVTSLPTKVGGM